MTISTLRISVKYKYDGVPPNTFPIPWPLNPDSTIRIWFQNESFETIYWGPHLYNIHRYDSISKGASGGTLEVIAESDPGTLEVVRVTNHDQAVDLTDSPPDMETKVLAEMHDKTILLLQELRDVVNIPRIIYPFNAALPPPTTDPGPPWPTPPNSICGSVDITIANYAEGAEPADTRPDGFWRLFPAAGDGCPSIELITGPALVVGSETLAPSAYADKRNHTGAVTNITIDQLGEEIIPGYDSYIHKIESLCYDPVSGYMMGIGRHRVLDELRYLLWSKDRGNTWTKNRWELDPNPGDLLFLLPITVNNINPFGVAWTGKRWAVVHGNLSGNYELIYSTDFDPLGDWTKKANLDFDPTIEYPSESFFLSAYELGNTIYLAARLWGKMRLYSTNLFHPDVIEYELRDSGGAPLDPPPDYATVTLFKDRAFLAAVFEKVIIWELLWEEADPRVLEAEPVYSNPNYINNSTLFANSGTSLCLAISPVTGSGLRSAFLLTEDPEEGVHVLPFDHPIGHLSRDVVYDTVHKQFVALGHMPPDQAGPWELFYTIESSPIAVGPSVEDSDLNKIYDAYPQYLMVSHASEAAGTDTIPAVVEPFPNTIHVIYAGQLVSTSIDAGQIFPSTREASIPGTIVGADCDGTQVVIRNSLGNLYETLDGGQNWTIVPNSPSINMDQSEGVFYVQHYNKWCLFDNAGVFYEATTGLGNVWVAKGTISSPNRNYTSLAYLSGPTYDILMCTSEVNGSAGSDRVHYSTTRDGAIGAIWVIDPTPESQGVHARLAASLTYIHANSESSIYRIIHPDTPVTPHGGWAIVYETSASTLPIPHIAVYTSPDGEVVYTNKAISLDDGAINSYVPTKNKTNQFFSRTLSDTRLLSYMSELVVLKRNPHEAVAACQTDSVAFQQNNVAPELFKYVFGY